MVDDVTLNKIAIIERCRTRIGEEYVGHEAELETDFTRQDSIILNLQRACKAAIDLAMHTARKHQLGLPQDARDAFTLTQNAGYIDAATATSMRAMVGFRNTAVHQYQDLSLAVLRAILNKHMGDFTRLTKQLIENDQPTR